MVHQGGGGEGREKGKRWWGIGWHDAKSWKTANFSKFGRIIRFLARDRLRSISSLFSSHCSLSQWSIAISFSFSSSLFFFFFFIFTLLFHHFFFYFHLCTFNSFFSFFLF
ncbi:hypothetical protein PFISCL1PPCAC_1550, partial [Pristionchus fissidentatus]